MPFVIIMIPITWITTNMIFKPRIRSLAPAMRHLEGEIVKMGKWNKHQIWAMIIFAVMVFGWFTEKEFYNLGIYPIRLGIGVIAVAGAVAYLLAGVVNWRDYQEKVDWGVVWLYAGAIIFGRTLDKTGAAYWLAQSVIDMLAPLGMSEGIPLMLTSNGLTAVLTNLMADGPAAAAVGPITLNMASIVHPGTTFLPFMAMATAVASSFAYCLIIGTPPNAIVYASGYLEPKDYLRVGIPMWFVANIMIVVLTAVYWCGLGFGSPSILLTILNLHPTTRRPVFGRAAGPYKEKTMKAETNNDHRFVHENGVTYFSKQTERRVLFVMTLAMLIWGHHRIYERIFLNTRGELWKPHVQTIPGWASGNTSKPFWTSLRSPAKHFEKVSSETGSRRALFFLMISGIFYCSVSMTYFFENSLSMGVVMMVNAIFMPAFGAAITFILFGMTGTKRVAYGRIFNVYAYASGCGHGRFLDSRSGDHHGTGSGSAHRHRPVQDHRGQ